MKHDVVVQPTEEPLTLKEVKTYLRVTHDSEDDLLAAEIVAARRLCENSARMSFLRQVRRSTYELPHTEYDNAFSLGVNLRDVDGISNRVYLVRGPVQSVESVMAYCNPDSMLVLDATQYFFHPAMQTIEWIESETDDAFRTNNYLQVDYTAGLDNATVFMAAYPDIIDAIKITIAAMYDEKGYSRQSVPPLAAHLLSM